MYEYLPKAKYNVFCPVFESNKTFECCTILSYPLYFMTERSNNNQFFYCNFRKNAPKRERNCVFILSVSLMKHFKNGLCPKPDILFKTARHENSGTLRLVKCFLSKQH